MRIIFKKILRTYTPGLDMTSKLICVYLHDLTIKPSDVQYSYTSCDLESPANTEPFTSLII